MGTTSKLFYFLFLTLVLGACGKLKTIAEEVPGGTDDDVAIDDSYPEPLPAPSATEYLYFRVYRGADNVEYPTHEVSSFAASCAVKKGETTAAKKEIDCYAEVNEFDLYYSDTILEVNAPKDMCQWMTVDPYYYYEHSPPLSQDAISVYYKTNASGAIIQSSVLVNAASPSGTKYANITSEGSLRCPWDYSGGNSGLPNCCDLNYSLTVDTCDDDLDTDDDCADAGDFVANPAKSVKWTGNRYNCLGGAGADMVGRTSNTNYPLGDVFFSKEAVSKKYTLQNPHAYNLSKAMLTETYFVGNYSPTALAAAVVPSPYYDIGCFDEAGEYNAHIRLQIRDWNEVSELKKAASGDPDTGGDETDEFPNGDPNNVGINDRCDWEDLIGVSRTYPYTSGGITTAPTPSYPASVCR